jgi:phenylacetate-CoA ligase
MRTTRAAEARQVEQKTRTEITEYQARQLVRTVDTVVKSKFWSERFLAAGVDPSSIRHPDDLYRAPTVDKHTYFAALSSNPASYGGLLTSDLEAILGEGAIAYRTTGTSGKQGKFINTHEGFQVFGDQGLELLKSAGAKPGDAVMLTWPLSFWAASWGFHYATRMGPFLAVPAGPPIDTAMRIALIREYRPSVVVLTPSYALTLGQAARDAGVKLADHGVRGLLMGGETFGELKRAKIEEAWGLPGGTRNFYGISEGGPLFAVECSEQEGLHLFEGDTIHQFWKPETNTPAEPGEIAEHVFTSVSQRTMATWFNFRSRDAARYTDEPCKCGRQTRRMWIAERLDDMVKVKGVNIFASGVEDLLSAVPGVGREFLLVINDGDARESLTLQIEVQAGPHQSATVGRVQKEMQQAWGINFAIECVAPNSLPKTEGKVRRWKDLRSKT